MKPFIVVLLLAVLCLSVGQTAANETGSEAADSAIGPNPVEAALDDTPGSGENEESEDRAVEKKFEQSCELIVDAETQDVCWNTYKEYLRYFQWGYSQRQDVILFQNLSTKLILIVVVSLVILGMYFAWYQFRIAMKAMRQKVDAGESLDGTSSQEEIKISGSEIVARSSYLGVIILIVSLAFFYLYLVFVYPIEEIL